jgi:phage-related baseplate assembly protein
MALPSEFAALEPYLEWDLATEPERYAKRLASSMADMQAFYDVAFPKLNDVIEYCDKFPLDDLPEDALHLLHLIYSLIMVAMAVEVMHQLRPTDAADAVMVRINEPVP